MTVFNLLVIIIAIIAVFAIFYFFLKFLISNIVGARLHEHDNVESYSQIEDIGKILYGNHGMGTEIFNGLTEEQKESFKPAFKEITSSKSK